MHALIREIISTLCQKPFTQALIQTSWFIVSSTFELNSLYFKLFLFLQWFLFLGVLLGGRIKDSWLLFSLSHHFHFNRWPNWLSLLGDTQLSKGSLIIGMASEWYLLVPEECWFLLTLIVSSHIRLLIMSNLLLMITFNQLLNWHFLLFDEWVFFVELDVNVCLEFFDPIKRRVWFLVLIPRLASLFIHLKLFSIFLFVVFFLFDICVVIVVCLLFGVCAAWSMDATKLALFAIHFVIIEVCVFNNLDWWFFSLIHFLVLGPWSNINPGSLKVVRHLRHLINLILVCGSKARQLILFLRWQQKLLMISSLSLLLCSIMDSLVFLQVLNWWNNVFRFLLISQVINLREFGHFMFILCFQDCFWLSLFTSILTKFVDLN